MKGGFFIGTTYLPRERARTKGVQILTDYELLALILRTGAPNQDVLMCAKEVLIQHGNVTQLGATTMKRLCKTNGIGESKALAILAAIELGKRVYQHAVLNEDIQVGSPLDCVNYFCQEFRFYQQEVFVVILLNTKNKIINYHEVYKGGLHDVVVHPREIFHYAIEASAAAIILAHNHPSGDPKPSQADIETTSKICEAGLILGIPVLDHVIIGHDSYYSLKEYNDM